MKEKIIEIHCAEEFDKMFLHMDSKYFNCRMGLLTNDLEILFSLKEKDLQEAYKKLLNSDNTYTKFEYLVEYEKEHYIAFNCYIPYINPENKLYKVEKEEALKLSQTELFKDVRLVFGNLKIGSILGYGHEFLFLIPVTIDETKLHQMEKEIYKAMYPFYSQGVKNHEERKNL